MGISYAEVLIALVLTLLAGLLLLGASGDAQTIHTYVKERNVASSIMYEQRIIPIIILKVFFILYFLYIYIFFLLSLD